MKLYPRGKQGLLQVKYRIPTHMRAALGRERTYDVWKSTGTSDPAIARRKAPGILASIIDQVERDYAAAKSNAPSIGRPDIINAALDLAGQQVRGDLDHDTAREILEAAFENLYGRSNVIDLQDRRSIRSATAMVEQPATYLPLSIALERHLNDMERRDVTASSINRTRSIVEEFLTWAGDPDVPAVNKKLAGQWITEKLVPLDLAEGTKVKRLGLLKGTWAFFVRTSIAPENPWTDMDALVKGSKRGRKKLVKRAWTPEEVSRIGELDPTDPIHAVCLIRLHSGIRVEEACCLKVEDIDLEAGTMAIGHGDDSVKTQSSVRVLPMHPVTRRVIEQWIPRATSEGYLFDLDRAGQDLKRSHNLNKRIGLWIRRAVSKDPAMTSYTLRHTYAQAMRDLGVDKETIEYTTGHRDQSMLFGTYATGVGLDRLRDAIERLDFGF